MYWFRWLGLRATLSRPYSRNIAHQLSIGFGRGISEASFSTVPCHMCGIMLMFATRRDVPAACSHSATGRPGRAQTKTLRESGHKGQVDRCIFQVTRLRQVVGWLRAVVFVSFFRYFCFFFAVAVPRLRKPSNAFPRRLCETPNKMHNTMCCTMCGVYRFSHVSSNFLVFLIDECVKRQN